MAKYCIGIDLGGTFIKFGLLDRSNKVSGIFQLPTPNDKGPEPVIQQMIAGGKRLLADNKLGVKDVLGAGIGSPGPLDFVNGIVRDLPNIPGFQNVPLRDRIAKGIGVPAELENDANAAGLGEYLAGAGKGYGDIVLLTLGTGVGSGIIVDGKILHGWHGTGAELGHIIVQPGGELCACGQRGCLERYSSATNMARYAMRLIQEGRESSLRETLGRQGSIDSRDIELAAKAGDKLAAEVWDRSLYYLAVGCVDICRIFDPDAIVLSGGLAKAGEQLLGPLRDHFRKLHWTIMDIMTRIVIATLGNDAGVIGAAGVAWQKFGGQKAAAAIK